MALSQVSVPLTRDQAYALVDAVMERDDLALTASAHEDEASGTWVFEATCDGEPDLQAFDALAREALGGEVEFSAERVDPEVDWIAKSLEGLPPVSAGGFYVYGSHITDPVPAGLIGIHIDAAQAFGTGHHETTTGCLEAISHVLKRRKPAAVLDLGTGTGVLAIALAKRLHQPIVATDIDPVAVRTTAENAAANAVAQYIVPVEAEGMSHWLIAANAPYDLIVANILAGPLAELAPEVGGAAVRGANIILSGILESQAPRVAAAYAQQGMKLTRTIRKKGWVTLILDKR